MGGKNLVIVESPSKAGTIKKYLGPDYEVRATIGHVKDLPKKRLGVDVDNNFEAEYTPIQGKEKVLNEIKKLAQSSKVIYLAPDPDREGEAIAWHIAEEIGQASRSKIKRVLFNEITKKAILESIKNPVELDEQKYESQQARRILDRLVGYKISPILWKKVKRGISAGRVQSVAVRLIVEREKEIQVFKSDEFWNIEGILEKDGKTFSARLTKEKGEKLEKLSIKNKEHADRLTHDLRSNVPWVITSIQKKERKRYPGPPFITSRLQQEASRKLRFTAKKTMTMAQMLYEGIDLGADGTVGLITYMRTDSNRISEEALGNVRSHILSTYGKDYLPEAPIHYKSKSGGKVQDAHEAIRPTSIDFPPERVREYLSPDQFKLYQLIWNRFVSCQMTPAIYDQTSVDFSSGPHELRSNGSILRFAGFTAVYTEGSDDDTSKEKDEEDVQLPALEEGQKFQPKDIISSQHFTQPPPRFTEASLVRELEEKGIGRPSTYANILSTIVDREYAEKKENRFFPTELGTVVTELLVENFPRILDLHFTAQMEENLDNIEEGKVKWVQILKNFYDGFEETLDRAKDKMRNIKQEEEPTDVPCRSCGSKMVVRWGRNGQFLACSKYPDCKTTSPFERKPDGSVVPVQQALTDEKCTECGSQLLIKTGRYGRFLACSAYPNCQFTKAISIGIKCPKDQCGGDLTERRTSKGKTFYGCTKYPKCDFASWDMPVATPCPQCEAPFVTKKISKRAGTLFACANKECGWKASAEEWAPPGQPIESN